ncbi:MAG TPA: hypothetical protein VK742_02230 [Candidatus Sulfotelmatobacter sp.]|jgi:hypothetical protein|nr:hypothetical protein [Candidatus Sulfotelmatobacter sp.]
MRALLLFLAFFTAVNAFAQSSSHFEIMRNIMAGGGTTVSSSAHFQLDSTIAQPLAAVPGSAHFSIQGGFWIRPAPVFFAPIKTGTNFTVSIQTELGESYTVQYASSLSALNWQNLLSVTGNGSVMTVTNPALGITDRYYRLMQQ